MFLCFFFVAHRECHRGSLFPFNGIEEVDFQRLPGSLTAGSPENQPLEKEIPNLETIIFRFNVKLAGGLNYFHIYSPLFGEMIHFDY